MRTVSAFIAALALTVGVLAAAEPSTTAPTTTPSPAPSPRGAIAFSSLAPRGWDLWVADLQAGKDRRLTDHPSLDYNAALSPDGQRIAFVSERDGNMEIYAARADGSELRRLTHDVALDDHPNWSPDGQRIVFVSTRAAPSADTPPGRAWNGIYVMNADGSRVRRLSPPADEAKGADYSPAWSPAGDRIAFASGDGAEGGTNVLVMNSDGTGRREVIADGGWPSFTADGAGLYFHSRRDGRWGIWRVRLDGSDPQRVTPREIEVFPPRASADGKWLVASVRRGGGERRRVELIELASGKMTPAQQQADDRAGDQWNPAISSDGRRVIYHQITTDDAVERDVEPWAAPPATSLKLLRIAGAFPAFSPDGRRLALAGGSFARLDLITLGSDADRRRTLYEGQQRSIFGVAWARDGQRIAFSHGRAFAAPDAAVDVATIDSDGGNHRRLTQEAANNAFPSFSPDGKQLVFRSGRGGSGAKNLYIMNADDGADVRRLTDGKWTDTMCDWSPTGEWIIFASDRDGPFEIWLIRPDGGGLRKLVTGGGRNNHPRFSRDGQWVVFTSKRAGHSAEEISLPHQPQPYGELFAVRTDGSGLLRLTHNGFEEGTPAWGP